MIMNRQTGRFLGESVLLGDTAADRMAVTRPADRLSEDWSNPFLWEFVDATAP